MPFKRLCSIAILSMITSGLMACSSSSYDINLEYEPEHTPRCGAAGNKLSVSVTNQRRNAADSFLVGQAATGMGNTATPAVVEKSIHAFFLDAIVAMFKAMKVSIAGPKDTPTLFLDALITDFWVSEYVTGVSLEYAQASAALDFTLYGPGKRNIVWHSTKRAYVRTPQTLLDATSELEDMANKAVNQLMTDLMQDQAFCHVLNSPPPRPVQNYQLPRFTQPPKPTRPDPYPDDELILD